MQIDYSREWRTLNKACRRLPQRCAFAGMFVTGVIGPSLPLLAQEVQPVRGGLRVVAKRSVLRIRGIKPIPIDPNQAIRPLANALMAMSRDMELETMANGEIRSGNLYIGEATNLFAGEVSTPEELNPNPVAFEAPFYILDAFGGALAEGTQEVAINRRAGTIASTRIETRGDFRRVLDTEMSMENGELFVRGTISVEDLNTGTIDMYSGGWSLANLDLWQNSFAWNAWNDAGQVAAAASSFQDEADAMTDGISGCPAASHGSVASCAAGIAVGVVIVLVIAIVCYVFCWFFMSNDRLRDTIRDLLRDSLQVPVMPRGGVPWAQPAFA